MVRRGAARAARAARGHAVIVQRFGISLCVGLPMRHLDALMVFEFSIFETNI
jgi:hypothetical protein